MLEMCIEMYGGASLSASLLKDSVEAERLNRKRLELVIPWAQRVRTAAAADAVAQAGLKQVALERVKPQRGEEEYYLGLSESYVAILLAMDSGSENTKKVTASCREARGNNVFFNKDYQMAITQFMEAYELRKEIKSYTFALLDADKLIAAYEKLGDLKAASEIEAEAIEIERAYKNRPQELQRRQQKLSTL